MRTVDLLPGEQLILNCRTHWRNYILPIIGAAFCCFSLYMQNKAGYYIIVKFVLGSGPWPHWAELTETILESSLLFLWARKAFKNLMIHYIITTERLILRVGFVSRRETELKLCYCSNLILNQSILGRLMGYGDFYLRSGGVDVFFNDVPRPAYFKKVLSRAITIATYDTVRAREEHVSKY